MGREIEYFGEKTISRWMDEVDVYTDKIEDIEKAMELLGVTVWEIRNKETGEVVKRSRIYQEWLEELEKKRKSYRFKKVTISAKEGRKNEYMAFYERFLKELKVCVELGVPIKNVLFDQEEMKFLFEIEEEFLEKIMPKWKKEVFENQKFVDIVIE